MTKETNTSTHHKYLPEEFTEETFEHMDSLKMYAFYSAPDTGKTTLILDRLQPFLKRTGKTCLYLTSRRYILDQVTAKVNSQIMTCWSYQRVESMLANNTLPRKEYDYIVCDEAHYFVEDALLGERTDLSFGFINKSKSIVILMTGTPESLMCIESSWEKPIEVLKDLDKSNHNVQTVCLAPYTRKGNDDEYHLKKHLEKLVRERKRILVYDSNATELYEQYMHFKSLETELGLNFSFICSRHNSLFKHCDEEQLERLAKTERIDADVLFVTSALNTGVSINEDYEYLFIFGHPSKTSIFQLIARVRKGSKETPRKLKTVFCAVPRWHSINTRKTQIENDLLFVDNKDEWKLKNTHSRRLPTFAQDDDSNDNRYDLNQMMIANKRHDLATLKEITSSSNIEEAFTDLFEDRYDNIKVTTLGVSLLVDLLDSFNHLEFLSKRQQNTIASLCKDHQLQHSISKINEQLETYGYIIRLESTLRKTKGKTQRVWIIKR